MTRTLGGVARVVRAESIDRAFKQLVPTSDPSNPGLEALDVGAEAVGLRRGGSVLLETARLQFSLH